MTYDNLPQDPVMLLSFINTKLRDQYPSLKALCDDLYLTPEKLTAKLASIGYQYDRQLNKFI